MYLSRIILCAEHFTKLPRTKYTPSSIAAEEPVSVALEVNNVADKLPAVIAPPLIALSTEILSPFTKATVTPAVVAPTEPVAFAVCVALPIYFTYKVGESVVVASE